MSCHVASYQLLLPCVGLDVEHVVVCLSKVNHELCASMFIIPKPIHHLPNNTSTAILPPGIRTSRSTTIPPNASHSTGFSIFQQSADRTATE